MNYWLEVKAVTSNKELQTARDRKGFSMKHMAGLLGYKSKVTYYNIEKNNVEVTLKTASKISKILEKPIIELFPSFFENEVQDTQTLKRN